MENGHFGLFFVSFDVILMHFMCRKPLKSIDRVMIFVIFACYRIYALLNVFLWSLGPSLGLLAAILGPLGAPWRLLKGFSGAQRPTDVPKIVSRAFQRRPRGFPEAPRGPQEVPRRPLSRPTDHWIEVVFHPLPFLHFSSVIFGPNFEVLLSYF